MKWTKYYKVNKRNKKPKVGDRKVKRHFCLFPKSWYDSKTNSKTYWWLTTVYIGYEYVDKETIRKDFGFEYIPSRWEKIGIVDNYSTAVELGWC